MTAMATVNDPEMIKILHKLWDLVRNDINHGCRHCEKIFSDVFEED